MIQLRFLSYSNFGLIADMYNQQAQKGWQIEKVKMSFIHVFKKQEAPLRQYRFAVNQNERSFSSFSDTEVKDFDDLAAEYGWHFVYRFYNMSLYALDPGAEKSLYNDDQEEIRLLQTNVKREILALTISLFLLLLLFFLTVGQVLGVDLFYSYSLPFLFLGQSLALILCLLALLDYLCFQRKNKGCQERDTIRYSKIILRKGYSILLILTLMVMVIGIILQFIFALPELGVGVFAALWSPFFVALLIGLLYRKKVKPSQTELANKKKIFVGMVGLVFILTFVAFSLVISNLTNKKPKQVESADYQVQKMAVGFLVPEHNRFSSKVEPLIIEKSKCVNERVAQELLMRIVKNARNHPAPGDRVAELNRPSGFGRVFQLAENRQFALQYKNIVIKGYGDLDNPNHWRAIQDVLEVQ